MAAGRAAPARRSADTTLQLVEVITSPQRTETLQKLVDQFEAANPGVKVEITSLPWGQAFEKLATMVQGGRSPTWSRCPTAGWRSTPTTTSWTSLEPWMDQVGQTEELTDRALEFGSVVDDTPYMIPYGFYLRAMF